MVSFLSACRSTFKTESFDSAQKEVSVEDECDTQELRISLLDHPELNEVDGSAVVSFPDQFVHLLVVCIAKERWIAVWKICTHGDCDVEWEKESSLVECPCHGSLFDIDGRVLQGPAVRPLTTYAVCRKDDELFLAQKES